MCRAPSTCPAPLQASRRGSRARAAAACRRAAQHPSFTAATTGGSRAAAAARDPAGMSRSLLATSSGGQGCGDALCAQVTCAACLSAFQAQAQVLAQGWHKSMLPSAPPACNPCPALSLTVPPLSSFAAAGRRATSPLAACSASPLWVLRGAAAAAAAAAGARPCTWRRQLAPRCRRASTPCMAARPAAPRAPAARPSGATRTASSCPELTD